jgi:hypothetical protein
LLVPVSWFKDFLRHGESSRQYAVLQRHVRCSYHHMLHRQVDFNIFVLCIDEIDACQAARKS